jgi:hypothetical protein
LTAVAGFVGLVDEASATFLVFRFGFSSPSCVGSIDGLDEELPGG